jgi:hypothetical protein
LSTELSTDQALEKGEVEEEKKQSELVIGDDMDT